MAGEWIGSRGSPPAVSLFESRLNRSDRFLVGPIHFPTVMLRTAGYRCLSCSFGSVFCALPERASRDGKQWRPAARGSEPRCTRRCRGNQWIISLHSGQLTNFEYFGSKRAQVKNSSITPRLSFRISRHFLTEHYPYSPQKPPPPMLKKACLSLERGGSSSSCFDFFATLRKADPVGFFSFSLPSP